MSRATAVSRRGFILLGGAALLAACTGKPAPEPATETPLITFTHRPPIGFDVAQVDIQQPFVSKGRAPNVEHLLANPPARVAERWAKDRLRARGDQGVARYSILDASITETTLKTDKTIQGIFKSQVDTRYDGRIEIRLDVQNSGGQGFANAVVTRSQTAREDLTLNERDALLIQFVEDMGRDLDARMNDEILRSLSRFMR
jgi:hypothetical protein